MIPWIYCAEKQLDLPSTLNSFLKICPILVHPVLLKLFWNISDVLPILLRGSESKQCAEEEGPDAYFEPYLLASVNIKSMSIKCSCITFGNSRTFFGTSHFDLDGQTRSKVEFYCITPWTVNS